RRGDFVIGLVPAVALSQGRVSGVVLTQWWYGGGGCDGSEMGWWWLLWIYVGMVVAAATDLSSK
ncbi:hypothetical protein A2U01_0067263, partial [Trifolium medium]|nr:hypothetical protein [Trifolium medium]